MYHYFSRIMYSYGVGITSGISIYSLLVFNNFEKQLYWDSIFNSKIISASITAFSIGCYMGFNSNPHFNCLIPYKHF